MGEIKFGTDGWRAVIAEDFTFANLDRVAQAAADYWKQHPVAGTATRTVVGYDRRFLSDAFARRTAEILAGNGFDVILTPDPTPTPSVSHAVRRHRGVGAVMVTASHNPAIFNGFKLKSWFGGAAGTEACRGVEALLDFSPVRALPFDDAVRSRQIVIEDLRPAHFDAVRRLVDFPRIAASGLRVAHEALFGVGAGCFEALLEGTTCRVTALNAGHDPFFGGLNPEPVPANYGPTAAWLRRHPHDICLVTDGDADRIGGMDGRGGAVSTHQLICLLLRHLVENRGQSGRVVKALTTTSMVDRMCAEYGLELTETAVGFKHISAELLADDVLVGFEESGGIGFPGHLPERDGLAAGMFLLELLAVAKQPLDRLLAGLEKRFGPHRYGRLDLRFPVGRRAELLEHCRTHPPTRLKGQPVVDVKDYDGVKFIARDGSWLMLRPSGTEPIVRVYAEAPTDAAVKALLEVGRRWTRIP